MPDIFWKLHLKSSPEKVYSYLSTDKGREKYWAEKSIEESNRITFVFINGLRYTGRILQTKPNEIFSLDYFNSTVVFTLDSDGKGGTDLTLENTGVSENEYAGMYPGWLSVLLALKAAVDFGIDLRNHDVQRSWDQGYVDN